MQVAVCADSFGVSDIEYGSNWVDILSQQVSVTNYSQVSASNLLISQQVDGALKQGADFIIVSFTSCTRGEKRHHGRLEPFSYHTASKQTTPFDQSDLDVLKEYFVRFFDLDLAIYQNHITIEHTLGRLVKSGIPFVFSPGGFEHSSFGGQQQNYFVEYIKHSSTINLWDFARTREFRPFYHITDPVIHKQISEYYIKEINKCLEH